LPERRRPQRALGAYFRRTRPGEPFPLWLRNECTSDPDLDPGHEEEWHEEEEDYDTPQPDYVGFLLRLTPLDGEAPELPDMVDGWFSHAPRPRKPAVCPIGVVADRIVRTEEE